MASPRTATSLVGEQATLLHTRHAYVHVVTKLPAMMLIFGRVELAAIAGVAVGRSLG